MGDIVATDQDDGVGERRADQGEALRLLGLQKGLPVAPLRAGRQDAFHGRRHCSGSVDAGVRRRGVGR